MNTLLLQSKKNHPCFNYDAKQKYARVHLPIAPHCNIQCAFCDRKYSCLNESRPGVSANVITPEQAVVYYRLLKEKLDNISVVGIAGPGDAFASHEATLETMKRIRAEDPEVLFCIASNGLEVLPHIEALKKFSITHMSITVNAVNPAIGAQIYKWVRWNKKIYRGEAAAQLLMRNQCDVIQALKGAGIDVKVNCVVIPGINDTHVIDIARTVGRLGVDIFNAIPLYPVANTEFAHITQMSPSQVRSLREQCSIYISQMTHCTRCRADAAGCLGQSLATSTVSQLMRQAQNIALDVSDKPYVAVASVDGINVNMHLGEARFFRIYEAKDDGFRIKEERVAPLPGSGDKRWEEMAALLHDCRAIAVNGVGKQPYEVLGSKGIKVYALNGQIDHVLSDLFYDNKTAIGSNSIDFCQKGGCSL